MRATVTRRSDVGVEIATEPTLPLCRACRHDVRVTDEPQSTPTGADAAPVVPSGAPVAADEATIAIRATSADDTATTKITRTAPTDAGPTPAGPSGAGPSGAGPTD